MLQKIEWKSVAGFPLLPFCAKHERFVTLISVRAVDAPLRWVCPYCVEEEVPTQYAVEEKCPVTRGFYSSTALADYGRSMNKPHVTYYCQHKGCDYKTDTGGKLSDHVWFIHTQGHSSATAPKVNVCRVEDCCKDGADFCVNCERVFCKDHLDFRDMCPACTPFYKPGEENWFTGM
jgi:hypothetical protein